MRIYTKDNELIIDGEGDHFFACKERGYAISVEGLTKDHPRLTVTGFVLHGEVDAEKFEEFLTTL